MSVTDPDVILVDPTRVTVDPASIVQQTFAANLGAVAPGIALLRGWVTIDAVVEGAASPAIVVGDLNDAEGSRTYQVVTGAGFRDTWREMRPGVVGFTCCHADDLTNATAGEEFDQRIDSMCSRAGWYPGMTNCSGGWIC